MVTACRALNVAQWSGITPLDNAPEWYVSALETINRLAALPENWDGYGSLRVQYDARQAAARLLSIVALQEAPMPHIAPVPGGGLQLEWNYGGRELEFEILPNGSLEYLATVENGVMIEGPLNNWNRQVPHVLGWLLSSNE